MKRSTKLLLCGGLAVALVAGASPAPMAISNGVLGVASANAYIEGEGRRVARRTSRRTAARVSSRTAPYYAAPRVYPALPGGCVAVKINGVTAWRCGGVYYRAASGGYIIFTP